MLPKSQGVRRDFDCSLDDEVELQVLLSVSDVYGAEVGGSTLMVEGVAWPHERSDDCCVASLVVLQSPASLRLVFLGRLKESGVEWGSWLVEGSLLIRRLDVSKVEVVVELRGIFTSQSPEGLIPSDLVVWCHFEGANWADLAVVLDGADNSG